MNISGEQFKTDDTGAWRLCGATIDGKRFNQRELIEIFGGDIKRLPVLQAPSPNDDHPPDARFPNMTSLRGDIESAMNQHEDNQNG